MSSLNLVVWLILRQMRTPLILLIFAYAVCILGLVLIPGKDAAGEAVYMTFFEALYFVSYTATTIGFGELTTHYFTPAQRLWVLVVIYVTVITWLYSIGKLIALLQDHRLRRLLKEVQFSRAVQRMSGKFVTVCGYDETGQALVRELSQHDIRVVVVDKDPDKIASLSLQDFDPPVAGLVGDASDPAVLAMSGVAQRNCKAVVALTASVEINAQIALEAKVLDPKVVVMARIPNRLVSQDLKQLGVEYPLDPFQIHGENFALRVNAPKVYQLLRLLEGDSGPYPRPPKGRYILCGYGRFGRSIYEHLQKIGLDVAIVEPNPPEATGDGPGIYKGSAMEAHILESAGVRNSVGVIAATDSDAANLDILMTARGLNPDIYMVTRENQPRSEGLFLALKVNEILHTHQRNAELVRRVITQPLAGAFFKRARQRGEDWGGQTLMRLREILAGEPPRLAEFSIYPASAPALERAILSGGDYTLAHLFHRLTDRDEPLPLVCLLYQHGSEILLTPDPIHTNLCIGDRFLAVGADWALEEFRLILENERECAYVLTGETPYDGYLFRYLAKAKLPLPIPRLSGW